MMIVIIEQKCKVYEYLNKFSMQMILIRKFSFKFISLMTRHSQVLYQKQNLTKHKTTIEIK